MPITKFLYKGVIINKIDKHNYSFVYNGDTYAGFKGVYECRARINELIKINATR